MLRLLEAQFNQGRNAEIALVASELRKQTAPRFLVDRIERGSLKLVNWIIFDGCWDRHVAYGRH